MPSDISRTSDEQQYGGVVMQQGRVILDRDFNALRETVDRRAASDALDFVGPSGTPDDGFLIGPSGQQSSSSSLDFAVAAGTMHVGGQRVALPAACTYFTQPEWTAPDPAPATPADEFVYLWLAEQEVGAVEDPELKDVALGGPDTTARTRLLKRIKRITVADTGCTAALADAAAVWQQAGLAFDSTTMLLNPQAALQVSYTAPAAQSNPCDPVAQGGYLGADNQLIRVQITDGGGTISPPQLLWGNDNASSLYRATVSTALSTPVGTVLVLGQAPVDAFHIPQQGQVVEVLRTAVVIGSEPGQTSSGQTGAVLRCVAEPTGITCTLATPYQSGSRALSLSVVLPAAYLNDTNPLFVRVWQTQTAFTPDGASPTLLTAANGSSTGLQVTIAGPGSGAYPPAGAFWMIAVRPGTPQGVYPERFLISPQLPDGPRQWACPLGTIAWTAVAPATTPATYTPAFSDCRSTFETLVQLSQRKLGGCCTITLYPEDLLADPSVLQEAADSFIGAAQGIAICLTPGAYTLSAPLMLNANHNGLTIEACQGAVTLLGSGNVSASVFFQGLVVLAGTDGITLKGITLIPPTVDMVSAIADPDVAAGASLQTAVNALRTPQMLIGVRMVDSTNLTVTDCQFTFQMPVAVDSWFGAGLMASGDCTGLTVRGSTFTGPGRTNSIIFQPIPEPVVPTPTPTPTPTPVRNPILGGPILGGPILQGPILHDPVTLEPTPTPITNPITNPIPFPVHLPILTLEPRTAEAGPAPAGSAAARPKPVPVVIAGRAVEAVTFAKPAVVESKLLVSRPTLPIGFNPVLRGPIFTEPVTVYHPIQGFRPTGSLNPGQIISIGNVYIPPILTVPPVMLAAVLVAPSIDPNYTAANDPNNLGPSIVDATWDRIEFSENTVEGLTLGMLVAAATGSVKIEDNTLTNCVGGIWFDAVNRVTVSDVTGFQSILAGMPLGASAGNALQLAMWYPLPQLAEPYSANTTAVYPQLHVVNNRLDAVPADNGLSGPACLIRFEPDAVAAAAGTATAGVFSGLLSTIMLNSNQLRSSGIAGTVNATDGSNYAATALLFGAANTVAGSNLVCNVQSSVVAPGSVQSLFVVPGSGGVFAASGNILRGAGNLGAARPELAPAVATGLANAGLSEAGTWDYLNNSAVNGGQ